MHVTILGAGAFGTALASVLETNRHSITFYDPLKHPDLSLAATLRSADVLIFAAPSSAAPDLLRQLPEQSRSLPLLLASKGFWSLAPFEAIFGDRLSLLSGPAFATDLKNHKKTTLTATSPLVRELFAAPYLSFDSTSDRLGVALCGTLKNIYAIFAGLVHLEQGTSDCRTFINYSLREMKSILRANSCDPATADLACGYGDLSLTATSPTSRNYQYGASLAAHPSAEQSSEKPRSSSSKKQSFFERDDAGFSVLQSKTDKSRDNTEQNRTKLANPTLEGLSALDSLKSSPITIPSNLKIFNTILERTDHAQQ